jgi:hypothetical protein
MRDFACQLFGIFDGTQGHLVAEGWIMDLQLLHETLSCTDEQKFRYTRLTLTSEVVRWWKSIEELLHLEIGLGTAISWGRFVEEFNMRFCLRAQRQLRAIEFHNLVQGSMTMEHYSSRFMELAWFVTNLILDEESKAEHFENGLNPCIKEGHVT